MAKTRDPAALRERASRLLERACNIEGTRREEARRQLQRSVDALCLYLEGTPKGTVVTFTKQFTRGGTNYRYAAIKTDRGWSTTGPCSPKGYSSQLFAAWLLGQTVDSGLAIAELEECMTHISVGSWKQLS